jgi:flagellar motor switch protein FliM
VSDVLSQSEIDQLLVAMSQGGITPDELVGGRRVRPFDFMRPSKFSKETLRTVELMHETFCRSVQTQLSGVVRTPVGIEVVSADQVTYREFLKSIPTPSLLSIVTMEPFEGNAVMEVNLPLALSIIDRLVGGPGTQRSTARELTEIEQALLANVTDILLGAFSEAWSTVMPVQFRLVGTEMDPQFAEVVTPSEMVVLVGFEVRIGEAVGTISLCVPYLVLEPAMDRLTTRGYFSNQSDTSTAESREGVAEQIGSVMVPVAVELGSAELNVEELLALDVGDVIPLAIGVGTDAVLRVGSRRAFAAQPGVRGRRIAVQITSPIEDSERMYA